MEYNSILTIGSKAKKLRQQYDLLVEHIKELKQPANFWSDDFYHNYFRHTRILEANSELNTVRIEIQELKKTCQEWLSSLPAEPNHSVSVPKQTNHRPFENTQEFVFDVRKNGKTQTVGPDSRPNIIKLAATYLAKGFTISKARPVTILTGKSVGNVAVNKLPLTKIETNDKRRFNLQMKKIYQTAVELLAQ